MSYAIHSIKIDHHDHTQYDRRILAEFDQVSLKSHKQSGIFMLDEYYDPPTNFKAFNSRDRSRVEILMRGLDRKRFNLYIGQMTVGIRNYKDSDGVSPPEDDFHYEGKSINTIFEDVHPFSPDCKPILSTFFTSKKDIMVIYNMNVIY